jgi:hypothetical protein
MAERCVRDTDTRRCALPLAPRTKLRTRSSRSPETPAESRRVRTPLRGVCRCTERKNTFCFMHGWFFLEHLELRLWGVTLVAGERVLLGSRSIVFRFHTWLVFMLVIAGCARLNTPNTKQEDYPDTSKYTQ